MRIQALGILAMAALAMTLIDARAGNTNEYIDCVVDVQWSSSTLRVELSDSTWDLGPVAQGGVADSWLGHSPHGQFWVRNTGDTNALIFVVAEPGDSGDPIIPSREFPPDPNEFAMAIATNITDVLADWMVFDQDFGPGPGRYVRDLIPGDYFLFDLRFYAGSQLPDGDNKSFRVGVYAASDVGHTP
jgi:hypothetical protein